jgi:predicted nucleic acid-binding protein
VNLVIFDTSVLVHDLRKGTYEDRVQNLAGLIRLSSVVLAELWRGAVTREEKNLLVQLSRNHPVLTPTEKNCIESGDILNKMRRAWLCSRETARNTFRCVDCAELTARSHGARLITANVNDCKLIQR